MIKKKTQKPDGLEAGGRIELPNTGFAVPRITTLLPGHHKSQMLIHIFKRNDKSELFASI